MGGAALHSRRAILPSWDGAACRPLFLVFLFLATAVSGLKNLPYAGPRPATPAHRATSPGLTVMLIQQHLRTGFSVPLNHRE